MTEFNWCRKIYTQANLVMCSVIKNNNGIWSKSNQLWLAEKLGNEFGMGEGRSLDYERIDMEGATGCFLIEGRIEGRLQGGLNGGIPYYVAYTYNDAGIVKKIRIRCSRDYSKRGEAMYTRDFDMDYDKQEVIWESKK